MRTDIRELLQKAENPSEKLDKAIGTELKNNNLFDYVTDYFNYSTDYNGTIKYIENKGYDWIMANINGHYGGTPFACVGVPESEASFSATPLLSLWLSFFRLELGDERKSKENTNER